MRVEIRDKPLFIMETTGFRTEIAANKYKKATPPILKLLRPNAPDDTVIPNTLALANPQFLLT